MGSIEPFFFAFVPSGICGLGDWGIGVIAGGLLLHIGPYSIISSAIWIFGLSFLVAIILNLYASFV
jgi:hypothetical protein